MTSFISLPDGEANFDSENLHTPTQAGRHGALPPETDVNDTQKAANPPGIFPLRASVMKS